MPKLSHWVFEIEVEKENKKGGKEFRVKKKRDKEVMSERKKSEKKKN